MIVRSYLYVNNLLKSFERNALAEWIQQRQKAKKAMREYAKSKVYYVEGKIGGMEYHAMGTGEVRDAAEGF